MSSRARWKRFGREFASWLLILFMAVVISNVSPAKAWAESSTAAMPEWLEPRGLSVLELVGHVPDAYLEGTILSNDDGTGLVVYKSGSRQGKTLTVTTKIYPRLVRQPTDPSNLLTSFGCLSQMPHLDHMASAVPASTLRLYDSRGLEITSQIRNLFVTRMGIQQPIANSRQPKRYPVDSYGYGGASMPFGAGGLRIPPSSGCRIWIARDDLYPLTGIFTLELSPSLETRVLGSQRATFKSYIGPGNVGVFQPLMSQMSETYGWRAGSVPLSIPSGATHFLLKYPTMPGDPYTDSHAGPPYLNADRPSAGTYRLARGHDLSADLTFSGAFPLTVAWQDADQASGSRFLPLIDQPLELATPEYVLPAGITYNNCFVQGSCPAGLLQQIYDTQMTLEIIYLRVVPPASGGQWVSLRMAGPAWSPTAATTEQIVAAPQRDHLSFLPLVAGGTGQGKLDGCPCGLVDDTGRILGLLPGDSGGP